MKNHCMAARCAAWHGEGQILCAHHMAICSAEVQIECRNAEDALNSDYSPENVKRWDLASLAADALEGRRDRIGYRYAEVI